MNILKKFDTEDEKRKYLTYKLGCEKTNKQYMEKQNQNKKTKETARGRGLN